MSVRSTSGSLRRALGDRCAEIDEPHAATLHPGQQQRAPAERRQAPPLRQRRERRRHLVRLLVEQAGDDQRARAAPPSASPPSSSSGRIRLAATVSAAGGALVAQVDALDAIERRRRWRRRWRAWPPARRSSLSTRCHRREAEPRRRDRQHPRAAAEVGERAARLEPEHQLERQPRGRVRAGAEGLAGVDHEVERAARAAPPTAGAPRAPARRASPTSTGSWNCRQRSAQSSATGSPRTLTRTPPDLRLALGKRRQLARRAVEGVLDEARRRRPARPRPAPAPAARRAPARPPPAGARNASRISGTRGAACRRSTRRPARAGCPRRATRAARSSSSRWRADQVARDHHVQHHLLVAAPAPPDRRHPAPAQRHDRAGLGAGLAPRSARRRRASAR